MITVGPIKLDERRLAEICRRYGVRELYVFGSAARGEARPNSDVDLLVEFLPEAEPGLLEPAPLADEKEMGRTQAVRLVTREKGGA